VQSPKKRNPADTTSNLNFARIPIPVMPAQAGIHDFSWRGAGFGSIIGGQLRKIKEVVDAAPSAA